MWIVLAILYIATGKPFACGILFAKIAKFGRKCFAVFGKYVCLVDVTKNGNLYLLNRIYQKWQTLFIKLQLPKMATVIVIHLVVSCMCFSFGLWEIPK